jgi:hypothetical protein
MPIARFAFAAVLWIGVVPAVAHGPFDGFWAFDPDICGNDRGTTDLVPIMIDFPHIQGYESQCTFETMERIGEGDAWRAELTCSGEGETWTRKAMFALDRDIEGSIRRLIEIDLDDGLVMVFEPCD